MFCFFLLLVFFACLVVAIGIFCNVGQALSLLIWFSCGPVVLGSLFLDASMMSVILVGSVPSSLEALRPLAPFYRCCLDPPHPCSWKSPSHKSVGWLGLWPVCIHGARLPLYRVYVRSGTVGFGTLLLNPKPFHPVAVVLHVSYGVLWTVQVGKFSWVDRPTHRGGGGWNGPPSARSMVGSTVLPFLHSFIPPPSHGPQAGCGWIGSGGLFLSTPICRSQIPSIHRR